MLKKKFILACLAFGVISGWCQGGGSGFAVAAEKTAPADLQGVTQNWDKKLPSASRFTVFAEFNNEAVRDNETGLVWEKSPLFTPNFWGILRFQCMERTTGGRKGWRLPSVHELASLVDPSVPSGLRLSPGHPFTGVQPGVYWSATLAAEQSDITWFVDFSTGNVFFSSNTNTSGGGVYPAWCVRGPVNADRY